MYLVTLFRIDNEVRFQDAVSQEIEYRVVKTCDHLDVATRYIDEIRNRMLMFNFPFAMIQRFSKDEQLEINEQMLFSYDEIGARYRLQEDMSFLTLATRRKLHDFEEDAQLKLSH